MSATILSHCLLHVPVVVLATQSLRDVLPAGDVVPEGQVEQIVALGDPWVALLSRGKKKTALL